MKQSEAPSIFQIGMGLNTGNKRSGILKFMLLFIAIIFLGCNKDNHSLPKVETGNNTIFAENSSVTCEGCVTDDGGSVVYDRGICYIYGEGTPTISDNKVSGGSGRGTFSCAFNLSENGKYSYRAYATNAEGTAYGAVKSFTYSYSSSSSVKVNFGNDIWYDDNPRFHYWSRTNDMSIYLCDNSLDKEVSLYFPFVEDIIKGTISPTIAMLVAAGGGPIYNIECNYYNGPTYQFDYPYGDEDFHDYYDLFVNVFYNNQAWIPKSYTLKVLDINTEENTLTFTLNAVMIKRLGLVNVEYTTTYINNAETKTLTVEAFDIPFEYEN